MTNLLNEQNKMNKIELIKELRAKTHFGMSACKEALEESDDDLDKAVEILQRKGLKKLDTVIEALEGEVRAHAEGKRGSIVEVNCQTDFAARSELFQKFVNSFWTKERFLGFSPEPEVESEKKSLQAVLREVVQVRRVDRVSVPAPSEGFVYAYNHPGGRIAVLVSLWCEVNEASTVFAEHVAMHIAANGAKYVNRTDVPMDLILKQKEFFKLDLPVGKKLEQLEKILEGKMNRWFSEIVLMEQQSVVDPKLTIAQVANLTNTKIVVLEFRRFERGESLK